MPELAFPDGLHFLRPLWLLGLLPALLVLLLVRWRDDPTRRWRGIIDAHLLEALRVKPVGRKLLRPVDLIVLVLVMGCLGAAGPAWEREAAPFSEDKAPLVIALDLSESMLAIDVPPTRLDRAKEKIRDILARRAGARTGLIVYAGSAHVVIPPTTDAAAFETFLAALDPSIMPVAGKAAGVALAKAQEMLDRDETPGSILFLTDGIPAKERAAFRTHASTRKEALLVLGVGTSEGGPIRKGAGFVTDSGGRRITARLDKEGLEALASEAGAFVATTTVDAHDTDRIQSRIESHLAEVRDLDAGERWKDEGYWLTLPMLVLAALWFRRGWTVRWLGIVLLGIGLAVPPPAEAQQGSAGWRLAELWLTRDQQGRLAFERGDFKEAAQRFEDPMWRGVAAYRAGDWDAAVDAFASLETADALYNLGNAHARRGDLVLAVKAYGQALERRPGWREATENRDRIAALIPAPKVAGRDDETARWEPNEPADEIRFDDKGKLGKQGKLELSDRQMSEIWLRGLTTSPGAFLREKFRAQNASRGPAK